MLLQQTLSLGFCHSHPFSSKVPPHLKIPKIGTASDSKPCPSPGPRCSCLRLRSQSPQDRTEHSLSASLVGAGPWAGRGTYFYPPQPRASQGCLQCVRDRTVPAPCCCHNWTSSSELGPDSQVHPVTLVPGHHQRAQGAWAVASGAGRETLLGPCAIQLPPKIQLQKNPRF